ncbi:MAG: hypothetical protein ACRD1U_10805 [Vicinamibacterales bacterium]
MPDKPNTTQHDRNTPHQDEDEHLGAVEGDRPTDSPNQGNPNGPGVNAEGLPDDPVSTAQDRIGANLDETEGG